ncbi:sigma-70 family RNA polymerase sigma factor [Actinoplanes sp. KI2]|uniref:RNA polymerase sigma factor n=1 Tax=Actinoplanes sp. KI2 TaxID=2983315 RepID=UPI0021D58D8D|nr:sigma-70 family RNA polymerase sigma factor [Actinoplanes sp. KI2]MCU7724948.1 sigma-70 family RNA polymerase sigma factor [Actinoplanes sp. KI2]
MAVADPQPPEPRVLRLVGAETYPSWEEVYRDNAERVYRLMFSRVGNRPDAEDLTTEVFLAAMPRLRPDASIGEVRAYLRATARTTLAEHWRRTLGRQVTSIDPDAIADEYAAPPGRPEAEGQVRRLLAALPERYRKILELRFLQAASIREAAANLGVSITHAKVLQYRALRAAAKLIDAEGR